MLHIGNGKIKFECDSFADALTEYEILTKELYNQFDDEDKKFFREHWNDVIAPWNFDKIPQKLEENIEKLLENFDKIDLSDDKIVSLVDDLLSTIESYKEIAHMDDNDDLKEKISHFYDKVNDVINKKKKDDDKKDVMELFYKHIQK